MTFNTFQKGLLVSFASLAFFPVGLFYLYKDKIIGNYELVSYVVVLTALIVFGVYGSNSILYPILFSNFMTLIFIIGFLDYGVWEHNNGDEYKCLQCTIMRSFIVAMLAIYIGFNSYEIYYGKTITLWIGNNITFTVSIPYSYVLLAFLVILLMLITKSYFKHKDTILFKSR